MKTIWKIIYGDEEMDCPKDGFIWDAYKKITPQAPLIPYPSNLNKTELYDDYIKSPTPI